VVVLERLHRVDVHVERVAVDGVRELVGELAVDCVGLVLGLGLLCGVVTWFTRIQDSDLLDLRRIAVVLANQIGFVLERVGLEDRTFLVQCDSERVVVDECVSVLRVTELLHLVEVSGEAIHA